MIEMAEKQLEAEAEDAMATEGERGREFYLCFSLRVNGKLGRCNECMTFSNSQTG